MRRLIYGITACLVFAVLANVLVYLSLWTQIGLTRPLLSVATLAVCGALLGVAVFVRRDRPWALWGSCLLLVYQAAFFLYRLALLHTGHMRVEARLVAGPVHTGLTITLLQWCIRPVSYAAVRLHLLPILALASMIVALTGRQPKPPVEAPSL